MGRLGRLEPTKSVIGIEIPARQASDISITRRLKRRGKDPTFIKRYLVGWHQVK